MSTALTRAALMAMLDPGSVRKPAMTITDQLAEFNAAFGYPTRATPAVPTADETELRLRLLTEEFLELLTAHGASKRLTESIQGLVESWVSFQAGGPGFRVDMAEVADALGDIDYIVEGTRLTYGIPRSEVANEIHRSNMAKRGGIADATGKLRKPPGWTPPDIAGVLRGAGWGG